MTWTGANPAYKSIIIEIERQTDRGAALIAASLIESQLLVAIKKHLVEDKDVANKLFKPSGPIGDFSAKVDLGLLLGLYDRPLCQIIHNIREVRNRFAHEVRAIDFNSKDIKKFCGDIYINPPPFDDLTTVFGRLFPAAPVEATAITEDFPVDTPRQQFMSACKYVLLYLGLLIAFGAERGASPP